jgi:hypothetical protein
VHDLSHDDLIAHRGPGDWSIQELVIHLADSDAIAIDRMKRILTEDNQPLLDADETAYVDRLGSCPMSNRSKTPSRSSTSAGGNRRAYFADSQTTRSRARVHITGSALSRSAACPANASLARYHGLLQSVINPGVMRSPLTNREAVLSSKIEGTSTSMSRTFCNRRLARHNLCEACGAT